MTLSGLEVCSLETYSFFMYIYTLESWRMSRNELFLFLISNSSKCQISSFVFCFFLCLSLSFFFSFFFFDKEIISGEHSVLTAMGDHPGHDVMSVRGPEK